MGEHCGELIEVAVNSDVIFRGRLIDLRVDTVRLPSGRTTTREVVVHPGAVAVVPITGEGEVILVRQFRHAVGQVLSEIPAGTLGPGEDPDECARRELEEETGLSPGELHKLFECYSAPGYCSELLHFYLASKLSPCQSTPEADENIALLRVPLSQAMNMVLSGEVRDAKSICGLMLAERWLRRR